MSPASARRELGRGERILPGICLGLAGAVLPDRPLADGGPERWTAA